ncbi:MAG: 16S rRNA (guanine(527)-N(7))-methyltransferase RsmG [Desulfobacteraceae bacterium]|nr:16S rRNA (guanine(527)-N(7))-methyltransferase RsmG [Desulfobacteraceae bacterium]
MKLGSDAWKELIRSGAERFGLTLEEAQLERFARHAEELAHWNRRINLTAIRDPEAVAVKHFLDSCAPAAWIPAEARVIDIGSGGGFPGIPLAVLRPLCDVVLLDASRKKANFMRHVSRSLSLANTTVIQGRAEELARQAGFRRSFDLAISRAFGSVEWFVSLAEPLLRPGGMAIAMRGRHAPSPAGDGAGEPSVPQPGNIYSYRLPGKGDRRSLLVFSPFSVVTPGAE